MIIDKDEIMKFSRSHSHSHGFTLIEVMVVVIIIAILAAIIVPNILKRPGQAQIVAASQDILSIQNALSLYKLDNKELLPSDIMRSIRS